MNKNNKSSEIRINGETAGKYLFLLVNPCFFPFPYDWIRIQRFTPGKHASVAEFVKTGDDKILSFWGLFPSLVI